MKKYRRSKRENSKNGLRDRRIVREIDDILDQMATKWAYRAENLIANVATSTTTKKKHHSH